MVFNFLSEMKKKTIKISDDNDEISMKKRILCPKCDKYSGVQFEDPMGILCRECNYSI